MPTECKKRPPVLTSALLIGGNAVGAGILGLPIKTGMAGMLPALLGMVCLWAAMWATGWILAQSLIRIQSQKADLAHLFNAELGKGAKWLAVTGYFINYYGIMVAYLAGAAAVLSALTGSIASREVWLLLFFLPATTAALFGLRLVRRLNAFLMLLLAISFCLLVFLAADNMDLNRFARMGWGFFPSTLPVIMTSFAYHNVIPITCRELGWQQNLVRRALLWGTLTPLVFGLVWIGATVGALPVDGQGAGNLAAAFRSDLPSTVPLAAALGSPVITLTGLVFSLCAIFTSYLAVCTGFMNFYKDLLANVLPQKSRAIRAALVFVPPLLVALVYPDLFLVALDVSGGLGVALVFGIAPAVILLKTSGPGLTAKRLLGYGLLALFVALCLLEIAQEAGWLHLAPSMEHWTGASKTMPGK